MTDNNEKEINYAYLAGAYQGRLQSLALTLISRGLVDMAYHEQVKALLEGENERIIQSERDYTCR